ncbi:nucleoside/nucleotide kinase family protein [Devosia sediminis]|uniref:Nucleoside/nucleotide kinase family protein n=1 Tax=Devosia sediminis TaxID=2798801 RepID=A0A934IYL7_9HYPH|nr:nucleoside/nucleotide kinase family protein [Devosia sediminis]MBJ3784617.1 nucleoside/nucleotide kinase family protein [Devosia sediminis]
MPETLALTPQQALSRLVPHILEMESAAGGQRIAIGIAGGPGAGKSTLAAELVTMLNAVKPGSAALVPMDGFHMKHAKIEAMGEVDRKGAPHTFEGAAFVSFLHHLKHATAPVSGPGYSRKIEDTVADAFTVAPDVRVLVVEGNYLLLTQGPWAGVKALLDYTVFIHVPRDLVRARLLRRHGEEGLFTEERNRAHVERNDLPNYDLVDQSREGADVVFALEVER